MWCFHELYIYKFRVRRLFIVVLFSRIWVKYLSCFIFFLYFYLLSIPQCSCALFASLNMQVIHSRHFIKHLLRMQFFFFRILRVSIKGQILRNWSDLGLLLLREKHVIFSILGLTSLSHKADLPEITISTLNSFPQIF